MALPWLTPCAGRSDKANLANETLEVQYELVKLRTSNNFSYIQGSHVLQFGSHIIDEEPAGDYLGIRIPSTPSLP